MVITVNSYFKENVRVFDTSVEGKNEMMEQYPLYTYFHKHGIKIIHWRWAAVMGCDISKDASGISDAGVKAFLLALALFDSNDT